MQTISFSHLSHPTELLLTCLAGFSCCVAVFPAYISWIKKRQFQQYVREDGPKSHAAKDKTPTAGGVVFTVLTPVFVPILWCLYGYDIEIWHMLPLSVALICGAIGFLDDFAKVTSKSNQGISGYLRLAVELATGFCAGALLVAFKQNILYVPFPDFFQSIFGGIVSTGATGSILGAWVPHPLFYILLAGFLVASTTNAFNLHDGMDGLSAGTGCQVFATISLILAFFGGQFLQYSTLAAGVAGALCAFLVFNRYPARIFMGDTGSLFIGGLMGMIVLCGGMVFLFVPLALIYIVEALSVMAQVIYFKLTKKMEGEEKLPIYKVVFTKLTKRLPGDGKRLFRMAPIHHHFEVVLQDRGIAEWQVVLMFWAAQAIICLGVIGLMLRIGLN